MVCSVVLTQYQRVSDRETDEIAIACCITMLCWCAI